MTELVEFQILTEKWGRAALSDGSTLLLRASLTYLRAAPEGADEYESRISSSTAVAANPSLRGAPSTPEEVRDKRAVEEFPSITMNPQAMSLYLLPNGRIVALRGVISRAHRTNVRDANRDPIYNVDFKAEMFLLGEVPNVSVPAAPAGAGKKRRGDLRSKTTKKTRRPAQN